MSLSAQTAYAQLLDATLSAEHTRSVADLPGSFAAKTVRGHKYWYFQYTEPSGKLRQVFVGPDGPDAHTLMALSQLRRNPRQPERRVDGPAMRVPPRNTPSRTERHENCSMSRSCPRSAGIRQPEWKTESASPTRSF